MHTIRLLAGGLQACLLEKVLLGCHSLQKSPLLGSLRVSTKYSIISESIDGMTYASRAMPQSECQSQCSSLHCEGS